MISKYTHTHTNDEQDIVDCTPFYICYKSNITGHIAHSPYSNVSGLNGAAMLMLVQSAVSSQGQI